MEKEKEYYIISGFNLIDNNRGTAALGYGSVPFLREFHQIGTLKALNFIVYKNPWNVGFSRQRKEVVKLGNEEILFYHSYIWFIDYLIYLYIPFFARFTKTARILKAVSFIAAINGGDGFSDIYGTNTFENRLFHINLAMREQIPLIILPQTLGPFKDASNLKVAEKILKYASKVYVRDLKFEPELQRMGVKYELTKDLSYYMKPEKGDIEIKPNSVGLNVSGLCYSNKFRDLSGCFDSYPLLIESIIKYFQENQVPVYLISHSYNYSSPEDTNDDLQASKEAYSRLKNKNNVYLIDRDLTSPQTKYLISQCKFFVGTRMHANFAAIFTNTPVFGLAYSYKYEGAFNYMGLKDHYASVLNINEADVDSIISKIDKKYKEALGL